MLERATAQMCLPHSFASRSGPSFGSSLLGLHSKLTALWLEGSVGGRTLGSHARIGALFSVYSFTPPASRDLSFS